jgi:Cellulose biosynthesis protein BcsS
VALQGPQENRTRATLGLLVSLLAVDILTAPVASAIDLPPPDSPGTPVVPKMDHVAVDGSTVISSLGDRSFDLNGTFAPWSDINESGLRLRLSGSANWYRFVTGDNPRTFGSGHSVEGNILAGYQISLPRVSFIGLIGGAAGESHDQGVSRTYWGAKTTVSMYATPWDSTMAYGSVSYSTVANSLQLQSKAGVRLLGPFYIGPEVNFSWRNVTPSFNNIAATRVGAHVSALAVGPVFVGISGGWAHNRDVGSGYYGGMNFYVTF